MRKFIVKTLLIVLPVFLIAILMEILLRQMANDYTLKKDYLDAHSGEIETLILGSSHSYYGINPDYFSSNTFNASHISQTLIYDFEILKKYQNSLKKLRTVVLSVSYFDLFYKLEEGAEPWRVKNYVIYYNMNIVHSLNYYFELLSYPFKVNIRRLVRYYMYGKSNITCTRLGWGTGFKSEYSHSLINSGKIAALRHTKYGINSNNFEDNFKENILALSSIIDWCKIKNIKVLLITLPAFETYIKNLNSVQLRTTINTASEFALKYENCVYANLLTDSSFIATDFYDSDHLSEIGAEKLSKIIDEIISAWN